MLLFWALTPISIAWIKQDFSLLFQVWLRYVVSAAALWILLMIRDSFRHELERFFQSAGYYFSRLSITALCTISFQLLYTWCFFIIPPGFGILLYQSQVIFSVLLGIIFLRAERELITRMGTIAGIFMALVGGSAVIVFQSHGFSVVFNFGILLALGGALSWSCVGLTLRVWVTDRLSPFFVVTIVFTMVSIYLTPFVWMQGPHVSGEPGMIKWGVLVGSGLLGIAGGQALYYFILPRMGFVPASSVQLLVPFLTGIFSFLLFDEQITVLQMAGGLLLLSGCYLVLLQRAKLLKQEYTRYDRSDRIG